MLCDGMISGSVEEIKDRKLPKMYLWFSWGWSSSMTHCAWQKRATFVISGQSSDHTKGTDRLYLQSILVDCGRSLKYMPMVTKPVWEKWLV